MLKARLCTRSGIILAAGAISFEKLLGVAVSLFVSLYKEEGKVQFRLTGRACGRTYCYKALKLYLSWNLAVYF